LQILDEELYVDLTSRKKIT